MLKPIAPARNAFIAEATSYPRKESAAVVVLHLGGIHWNNRGCRSYSWRCITYLENTGIACKARTVNELLLQNIIVGAINKLLSDKTSYLGVLQENIATVVKASSAVSESDIDTKLMALQKELLKKANNKDDYRRPCRGDI